MKDFVGTKVALVSKDKVLMILRDNKPDINFPGMWDFPGGKREANEAPANVAVREIKEELGIDVADNKILWQGYFPATANHKETASFMVIDINKAQVDSIVFGDEGQKWLFMSFQEFFNHHNVVPGLKERLWAYLNSLKNENR